MNHETLLTHAERTAFRETGRIAEVESLCAAFQHSWPDAVRAFEYGRTAEDRPMLALLVTRSGAVCAADLRARKVPLVMIQGGIHPGESDGKDAGFIALRGMLDGSVPTAALDRIALLFVPAFNTDGHERFGRWNRPNQQGPLETGWRTTAQNLNLNRDYTKADSPEMRAMLRLINHWDPLVCADLHVTDGADFQPDLSLQVEPLNQGDATLRTAGRELRDELIAGVGRHGRTPLPFYPDFARTDDPASGFALTVYSPRFSTGYFAQRNRFTVLVETHSWKSYEHRVRVTVHVILELVVLSGTRGTQWIELARAADQAATHLQGAEVVLDHATGWREPARAGGRTASRDPSSSARMIDFEGYAYTRQPSDISGDLVTVYNANVPQIWHVPLRDEVRASIVTKVPHAGYVLPPAFAPDLIVRLEAHGIAFARLSRRMANAEVETFRASSVVFSSAPFEGRTRATLQGEWACDAMDIPAQAVFIPVAQPLVRLVLALFEPRAPDSFAAWGFFNACFETKEQMEPYVAEQIARDMLASNPALKSEFAARLAADPAFAADPGARLEFFLRRHESWDARHNLYPVFRLANAPVASIDVPVS